MTTIHELHESELTQVEGGCHYCCFPCFGVGVGLAIGLSAGVAAAGGGGGAAAAAAGGGAAAAAAAF